MCADLSEGDSAGPGPVVMIHVVTCRCDQEMLDPVDLYWLMAEPAGERWRGMQPRVTDLCKSFCLQKNVSRRIGMTGTAACSLVVHLHQDGGRDTFEPLHS